LILCGWKAELQVAGQFRGFDWDKLDFGTEQGIGFDLVEIQLVQPAVPEAAAVDDVVVAVVAVVVVAYAAVAAEEPPGYATPYFAGQHAK
jgi:hypothetical protein